MLCKNKHMEQWDWTVDVAINPHGYSWFSTKMTKHVLENRQKMELCKQDIHI
jgi:hypothetical protein